MSTNLLINTVLSASVQSLCQLMNGLQLIVHLPLLKIIFPPNVLMFVLPLVNVANFDIIPVHLVYPYVFDFQASEPYNQQFEVVGYESAYFMENDGRTSKKAANPPGC